MTEEKQGSSLDVRIRKLFASYRRGLTVSLDSM